MIGQTSHKAYDLRFAFQSQKSSKWEQVVEIHESS